MAIVYYHLPKCGGRSFNRILSNVYQDKFRFIDKHESAQAPEILARERYEAYGGYIYYGDHAWMDNPKIITVTRHPVDRLMSYYKFLRRQPMRHPEKRFVNGRSFREFARCNWRQVSNAQTASLVGYRDKLPNNVTYSEYIKAGNNLRYMDYVGVTDRFREFVRRVAKDLGWNVGRIPHLNRSNIPPAKLKNELLDYVLQKNVHDMKIYAMSMRIMNTSLDGVPF